MTTDQEQMLSQILHTTPTPPDLHLDLDGVVVTAQETRRRRVRRRAAAAGATAAATLAGVLWLGSPLDLGSSSAQISPAAPTTGSDDPVSLLELGPEWSGQLHMTQDLDTSELVLTRDGVELEAVPAEGGPGDVVLFQVDNFAVAVWEPPKGSRAESLLWADDVVTGTGGSILIDGTELRYQTREFSNGTEPHLVELYWFTDDKANAASGAPLASDVLESGRARSVVMIDEARQVWSERTWMVDLPSEAAPVPSVVPLVGDAGVSRHTGVDTDGTTVGVLPPGAEPYVVDDDTEADLTTLGSHPVVLVTTGMSPGVPPVIRFTLEGRQYTLEAYLEASSPE